MKTIEFERLLDKEYKQSLPPNIYAAMLRMIELFILYNQDSTINMSAAFSEGKWLTDLEILINEIDNFKSPAAKLFRMSKKEFRNVEIGRIWEIEYGSYVRGNEAGRNRMHIINELFYGVKEIVGGLVEKTKNFENYLSNYRRALEKNNVELKKYELSILGNYFTFKMFSESLSKSDAVTIVRTEFNKVTIKRNKDNEIQILHYPSTSSGSYEWEVIDAMASYLNIMI